jgi:DNA-binding LacI/PurR family transcriptional regulator
MSKKIGTTIADIARLAGVSKSTVSRALSNSPLICQETTERVRAIAHQNNFQVNVAAQRLSKMESKTIAFVTCIDPNESFSMTDLFGLEMLGAISHALALNQYDLLMAHVKPNDVSWIDQYLTTGRADGFILMTSTHKQYHVHSLIEHHAPFIVWGSPLPRQSYCSVSGDDFKGGKLATEHLLKAGKRKIAFLGGPADEQEVQHRFEGFETALRAAGNPPDPALVLHADWTAETAAQATRRLLAQAPEVEAVFVNSDVMAIAAMDVIRATGRQVPEDVAVVGYDNLSIAAISHPALTTISQNLPLAGRLLAENLIQYLQKGIVTNVCVPVELVVRQSA